MRPLICKALFNRALQETLRRFPGTGNKAVGPPANFLNNGKQSQAFFSQFVVEPYGIVLILDLSNQAHFLHQQQPVAENARGNTFGGLKKLREPFFSRQQIPHQNEGPPVA